MSAARRTSPKKTAASYQVIGTRPIRPDGIDKVTGRAVYGADLRLPGMLFGAVLRSPHAHARILAIDTSQAEALPGVKAVITAADLPENTPATEAGQKYARNNILAGEKALYHGHAIAAVAAASLIIAQQACALIQVAYEILPPVLDVRQALQPDAPVLLDDLRTDEMGKRGEQPTNLAAHYQYTAGDLDKGFAEAEVIVEREFNTATVHQGYLEPQNATAQHNPDGQITIWTSTQDYFGVRDATAGVLDVPVGKIRVIPTEIGGGFGGKNTIYLQPLAALLSKKSGYRPVKMAMRYDEVLAASGPGSASYIHVKVGANRQGKITAAQASLFYAAGAFPGSAVTSGMGCIFGPYQIENQRLDGYDVVVNRPKVESYRAPGGTNANFAGEVVIDELAEKLNIDPLEFRLRNAVREGSQGAWGTIYPPIGCVETIQAARQHPHYSAPLATCSDNPPGRLYHGGEMRYGRGVALATWGNYGGKSSASATVNSDGTVSLLEGSVDLGGSRLVIAMQLAETLGIPVQQVRPLVGDSDTVGYTEGSYGSRVTFATGWAAYELGQKLNAQLCERAARLWEVPPQQVSCARGVFTCGEKQLIFKELAARLDETGSPVTASASVRAENWGAAFALHIVDLAVDVETGKVQLLRYTAVQDVGTAIHPAQVEGQVQGGTAQGIGWALSEGYLYDEQGRLLNGSLLDYRLPTCLDLPPIEVVLVEVPNPGHPYGVRGVGEAPILPPPAAIANAIYRATGVRMSVLPMSPTALLAALL